MPIQRSRMLLGSCTATLTDLSCIQVYMRKVTRMMVLDSNTAVYALILCEMGCYSMQLLWYDPIFALLRYDHVSNINIVL